MALLNKPTRHRPQFHPLTVAAVERLTDDAAALTFTVPEALREEFTFAPGQHLTLKVDRDGQEQRRSYSICLSRNAAHERGVLRVAAGRVRGGAVSPWLVDEVRPGDTLEVMPPLGSFVVPTDPTKARHHCAIVAGSGITPVLSLLTTVLEEEPQSRVTLMFGNRSTSSIMFLEELEDLKNRYRGRFQLMHVLSREARDVELFSGRLDEDRLRSIFEGLVPVDSVDEWYLCGPFSLVENAREVLAAEGVDPAHVHFEVFHVDDEPRAVHDPGVGADEGPTGVLATVTVNLDGRTTEIAMTDPAETILAATLRARPDAPYSCTGGVCGTCRARLVEGEVRMDRNYALEPDEVADGIVLACQSHPLTETVRLDYDA
ncbi:1,2-phenylacetyl-CoA epoxidase subunit PaaE [Arsenicicoccus sp. oral taxon 190]|uniref:1,2-phenylacetyl-CoA epoxidase subunit PaaE n=1 Tax=Arsenicicoccus sp. oral taxon 190 TaxID=1658671 RepID=UPI00067A251E|nr:1,2-phenylacetyl-CoA epoxidase subunit PaaE [Arsenicicoccus sp. oral taxon 190]AKT51550.1 phenylacetic acid degradation protein [Arsenicicoccus sp. oral taxon 190]